MSKKDGRLIKNSDLTLEKEKPIIEETSVSSIDQITSDVEHASNDIVERQLSSAGGARTEKGRQVCSDRSVQSGNRSDRSLWKF